MVNDGIMIISYQPINNINAFRIVFINPILEEEELDKK